MPLSSASPQSEQDTVTALAAATEQVRILTQRVQHLEQELINAQRDGTTVVPRLPSLRSMMQSEVEKRYGQLCPTCGQTDRSLITSKDTPVRRLSGGIPSANTPVSIHASSEIDARSASMSSYAITTGGRPETPTSSVFSGQPMISPAGPQRQNGQYSMALPKLHSLNPSRGSCYECHIKSLAVCYHSLAITLRGTTTDITLV